MNNAHNLNLELGWLEKLIRLRFTQVLRKGPSLNALNPFQKGEADSFTTEFTDYADLRGIPQPELLAENSAYADFVLEHSLKFEERILLILSLANHIRPDFLSGLFLYGPINSHLHPEFGGISGTHFRGFIPTGLTYLFIMGGHHFADRLQAQQLFTRDHALAQQGVILLEPHFKGEPSLSGMLTVADRWIQLFTEKRHASS